MSFSTHVRGMATLKESKYIFFLDRLTTGHVSFCHHFMSIACLKLVHILIFCKMAQQNKWSQRSKGGPGEEIWIYTNEVDHSWGGAIGDLKHLKSEKLSKYLKKKNVKNPGLSIRVFTRLKWSWLLQVLKFSKDSYRL